MGHDQETLRAFQSGETALVYARYRDRPDEPPYFLIDGTASDLQVRAMAEQVECLMPECPDRRLRVVNRHSSVRTARDGFRHHAGAGCNPTAESLFHKSGKEAVRRWVLTHRPGLRVEVEVPLPGRERVADVMVTSPDGRRLAIEIQYAKIGVAEIEERTRAYRDAGIGIQWVFGHHGHHFKPDEHLTWLSGVRLGDAQRAVIKAGCRLLWLNPISGQVATPTVGDYLAGREWWMSPTGDEAWARVSVEAFDDAVTIDPEHGFVTPAMARAITEAAAYRDAKQAERRRLAAERARRYARSQERSRRGRRNLDLVFDPPPSVLAREARERREERERREQEEARARSDEIRRQASEEHRRRQDEIRETRMRRLAEIRAKRREADQSRDDRPEPVPSQKPADGAPTEIPRPKRFCGGRGCGRQLDGEVYLRGYHYGCEPSWWRDDPER